MDISSLSNSELRAALVAQGISPGPIVSTTRSVWERKLIKLMQPDSSPSAPVVDQNDDYEEEEEEDDDVEVVNDTFEGEESFRYVREEKKQTTYRSSSDQWPTPVRAPPTTSVPKSRGSYARQPTQAAAPTSSAPWWLMMAVALLLTIFAYFLLQRIGGEESGKEEF